MNSIKPDYIDRVVLRLSDKDPFRWWHYIIRHCGKAAFDMHFELELGIVLSGRLRRTYRNKKIDLDPGEVWLSGIWEPHGTHALKIPCEVVVILFWPGLPANMRFPDTPRFNALSLFTVDPKARPQVPPSARSQTLALGRNLVELIDRNNPMQKLWLRIRIMEILLILHENMRTTSRPSLPAAAFQTINQAIEMVFANRCRITIDAAARSCGLSRVNFQKLFSKTMGISFYHFALRHRLSGAADQILGTPKPLKALAREWGFVDESHFHHHFLKHYGCSPSEYRRQKGRIL